MFTVSQTFSYYKYKTLSKSAKWKGSDVSKKICRPFPRPEGIGRKPQEPLSPGFSNSANATKLGNAFRALRVNMKRRMSDYFSSCCDRNSNKEDLIMISMLI